jgi:hypothetical protein
MQNGKRFQNPAVLHEQTEEKARADAERLLDVGALHIAEDIPASSLVNRLPVLDAEPGRICPMARWRQFSGELPEMSTSQL